MCVCVLAHGLIIPFIFLTCLFFSFRLISKMQIVERQSVGREYSVGDIQ